MEFLVSQDLAVKPPPATGEGAAPGDMDERGPHPWRPISDPVLKARFDREMAGAEAAARRYPTLETAIRAGYVLTPLVEPGVGVHAVNWGLVGAFDPARPAMLLFESTLPTAPLIALSYYIISPPDEQPAGFAGDNDHWHNHIDICIKDGVLLPTTHLPADCSARGGTYLTGRNLWMLHAWVVAGVENPWGVFATYNPRLHGGDESEAR